VDPRKFLATEWIAFLMIFGVATYAMFTRFMTGNEWGLTTVAAAVNLVAVRWHKKKVSMQKELGSFDPPEVP